MLAVACERAPFASLGAPMERASVAVSQSVPL